MPNYPHTPAPPFQAEPITPPAQPAPYVPTRADEIQSRLATIDRESIRAIRSSSAARNGGRPVPQADANKLEALETEAAALRAELAALA